MDRSQGTDAERLDELRSEGIVPYSPFATACAGAVGALMGIGAAKNEIAAVFSTLRKHSLEGGPDMAKMTQYLDAVNGPMLRALFIPVGVALACALAVGLLQTRFLFRVSELSLRLDRLSPASNVSLPAYLRRVLIALPVAVLSCLGAAVLVLLLSRDMLSPLANSHDFLPFWARKLWISLVAIMCIVLSVLGTLAWIGRRVLFLRRHRSGFHEVHRHE